MRFELNKFDIYDYFSIMFLRLRIYSMSLYYHNVLMISKQFKSSSMSWIFLLWIDDFWMIWDKCHELCLSMRNSTIECILTCEIERQEWVVWSFRYLKWFDKQMYLILRKLVLSWVELGIHKMFMIFRWDIYLCFGLYNRTMSWYWLRWIS